MSDRDMVIRYVTERMTHQFVKGQFTDAQNMSCFILSLEHMSDAEYAEMSAEEVPGAIS